MKKLFSIQVPKIKVRKQLPSELVVTKIHKSAKDHKRNKTKFTNLRIEDLDTLDDRFYE